MFSPFKAVANFFKEQSGPKCPECYSVFIDEVCPNLDCPVKVAEWITHWCSPEALKIPTLDQAKAGQLAKLLAMVKGHGHRVQRLCSLS